MLDDNDYESLFGTATTVLQTAPRARPNGGDSAVVSIPGGAARGADATRLVLPPPPTRVRPWLRGHDCDDDGDMEQTTSSPAIRPALEMPVYDIDDGAYTDVDLDDDDQVDDMIAQVSSGSDPQVIVIASSTKKNKRTHGEESEEDASVADRPRKTWCSSICCLR